MNGIGRLGELYGLSPATMAGLANVAGVPPPPPPPAAPPVDPDSPEAWAAAAAAAGDTNAQSFVAPPTSPNPLARSNPNSAAAIAAGVKPDNPAAAAEAARQQALADATPQAPPETPEDAALRRAQEADQAHARDIIAQQQQNVKVGAIPAHWQPGSHTVALQHGMAPGELEPGQYHRDVAAGHSLLAADKRLEGAQQAGMADAVYASAHAMASQQANERLAQLNQERDRYITNETKKLDQMAAATQKEVDPDAYWKAKGGGAKVAAALMIGLNQFAVMWRGRGTNTAMEMINEAVDNNIKAQQANIANAKSALDQRQNLYARNLAVFGDRERAVLATKMQYLDQVGALADAQRAKAGQADAEAGYHDLIAKVNATKADYADQFSKLTHTQANEQMNEVFKPTQYMAMGGGAAGDVGEKGKEELYVPDLGIYARTKEEAVKIRDHSYRTQVIVRALNDAKDVYARAEKTSDPRELRALQKELEGIKSRAAVVQTVKEGQGAMSKGDQEVSDSANALLDGSVWRPNPELRSQAKLVDKAVTFAQQEHGRLGSGGQRGTEVYVRDAKGNLVPRAVLFGTNAAQRNLTDNLDDKVQAPKGEPQKRR